MQNLARYSEHLSGLIQAVDSERFPLRLIELLKAMVQIDDATIVVYPGLQLPVIEYFELPQNGAPSTLDKYVRGAFLLDPYYLAAADKKKFGVFRLRELAPKGFRDSDYYKNWYRNCGYQDECGYLIEIGAEGFVNIALGRTATRAVFSKREVDTLRAIRPAIETLCRQHWNLDEPPPTEIHLRARLHEALNAFGSSLLTERESQVINLVLQGHSTKTLAERLSISVETVKLHRKHAYAKLEVNSQAELFHLFLDSVMSAEHYAGGDPLSSYQRPPFA